MARPSVVFSFATDANFSSGPRAGQPVRLTPGAGVSSQGFVPGSTFASQYRNYELNLVGNWIAHWDAEFQNVIDAYFDGSATDTTLVQAFDSKADLDAANVFTDENTFENDVSHTDGALTITSGTVTPISGLGLEGGLSYAGGSHLFRVTEAPSIVVDLFETAGLSSTPEATLVLPDTNVGSFRTFAGRVTIPDNGGVGYREFSLLGLFDADMIVMAEFDISYFVEGAPANSENARVRVIANAINNTATWNSSTISLGAGVAAISVDTSHNSYNLRLANSTASDVDLVVWGWVRALAVLDP